MRAFCPLFIEFMNKSFFTKTRQIKVLGLPFIQLTETIEVINNVSETRRIIIPVELSQEYIDEEFNI